jgi:hypothetical protein
MWWLVIIVFGLLIPEILSTILDSRLGRALAAQVEGRSGGRDAGVLADRIQTLEGEIDRLSMDVQRLSEESEFLQRLLSERSSQGTRPPPPGDEKL